MSCGRNLLAWIEAREAEFVAAFVGEGALPDPGRAYQGRMPAECVCSSRAEARQWIENQATAFGPMSHCLFDLPMWVAAAS